MTIYIVLVLIRLSHLVKAVVCEKSISYVTVTHVHVLVQTFLQWLIGAYMYIQHIQHRFFSMGYRILIIYIHVALVLVEHKIKIILLE